jgi:Autophagy-related protein 101
MMLIKTAFTVLGYMDVDCDFIDFTYVCCTSQSLDRTIKREISTFSEQLQSNEGIPFMHENLFFC